VDNRIFVMTFDNLYSCNQKAIAEEILRRDLPVEIFWACPEQGAVPSGFPRQIHLVRRGSFEMFEAQATSRVWLDNALNCVWFDMPKKKSQVYLNTWHGSLGIKRLGGSRLWMLRAGRCDRTTDYCITNSTFEEDVFRSTFWPSTPFLPYGHPRNDVFFHESAMEEKRKAVLARYRLPDDVRICLYAPTFRESSMGEYEPLDCAALRSALERRFGGRWILMLRRHLKDALSQGGAPEGWDIDASDFGNMQDLLPAVDVGLSDYSSWVFDYILTRRPVFLYVPDIDRYDQARGFYYPLETTPFPLARSRGELSERILAFDADAYRRDADAFLEDKGCFEDGHAAERVVDKLEELIGISSARPESSQ